MRVASDLPRGIRAVSTILDRLAQPTDLATRFAQAVVAAATRKASGAPSPQAAAVSTGLAVSGGTITVADRQVLSGGGRAADLFWGAERGSTLYRQMGPRVDGGAWMAPAAQDPGALAEAEAWADDLFRRVS